MQNKKCYKNSELQKNDEKLKKNSDDWKYRNFRRLKEYKQCFE